jgi:UDP-2,3-diacylglucosamine pyrophosphatase LpxH
MAAWYAQKGYTLVENGDVEDLIVTEPVESGAWLNCLIQGIGGQIAYRLDDGFRRIQRRRQLLRIRETYAARYAHLVEVFGADRIVKLVGNHDVELLQPEFRAILSPALPGVLVTEFLVLVGRGTPIVVCHGHQMDPWTCHASARGVGESISESFAWAGQGADRIWLFDDWGPPLSADNVAVAAPSFAPRKSFGVPKVRHMGERYMFRQMTRMFPANERPWLVLGHTHEPRLLVADRYANAGAAGRYQDLVWAVEIDDGGQPKLYGWWCEDEGEDEVLYRGELLPTGHRVVCTDRQRIGTLAPLPYGPRPEAAEVNRVVDRIEPLSRIPWMALAVRSFVHVAALLVGGWVVFAAIRAWWTSS